MSARPSTRAGCRRAAVPSNKGDVTAACANYNAPPRAVSKKKHRRGIRPDRLSHQAQPDVQQMVGGARAKQPLEPRRFGPPGVCAGGLDFALEEAFRVRGEASGAGRRQQLRHARHKVPGVAVGPKHVATLKAVQQHVTQGLAQ